MHRIEAPWSLSGTQTQILLHVQMLLLDLGII